MLSSPAATSAAAALAGRKSWTAAASARCATQNARCTCVSTPTSDNSDTGTVVVSRAFFAMRESPSPTRVFPQNAMCPGHPKMQCAQVILRV